MRLQFDPRREPPDLLDLPWSTPLECWGDPRMVRMVAGPASHEVRFVLDGERVYALKELPGPAAEREYAVLRLLAGDHLPVVEAVGLVTGRRTAAGDPLDAVLITRYLDYSLPFRYLLASQGGASLARRLIDAGVVLLARLHLQGFYWGDCSLANLLFRRDAGELAAYLVDAETAEHHDDPLGVGYREADMELAKENVLGGLLDLQAEGSLPEDLDAVGYALAFEERYRQLWEELTGALEADAGARHVVEYRIRRLNDLGFDVGELVVEHDAAHARVRVTPALVEEGHHSSELRRLTGLEVQENQARRILNDIASYGAHVAQVEGRPLPRAVVAARWIADVFEPVVSAVPLELRGRREPAELLHELLEHRYYLSEAAGHDVGTRAALESYVSSVLPFQPEERLLLDEG